jgi:hypothetical protein
MALSAREAAFRATHGMSSGGWNAARRTASAFGVKGPTFDKLYRTATGKEHVKTIVDAKRAAHKDPSEERVQAIYDAVDDLYEYDNDVDIEWGS